MSNLQSSTSNLRGFVAKVGDFGTSRMLTGAAAGATSTAEGEGAAVVSNFGTVSHMVSC